MFTICSWMSHRLWEWLNDSCAWLPDMCFETTIIQTGNGCLSCRPNPLNISHMSSCIFILLKYFYSYRLSKTVLLVSVNTFFLSLFFINATWVCLFFIQWKCFSSVHELIEFSHIVCSYILNKYLWNRMHFYCCRLGKVYCIHN